MKINKKILIALLTFALVGSAVFVSAEKVFAQTKQQSEDGLDACVDTRYADETEQKAIIRCCGQWPDADICTILKENNSPKICIPSCDAGFACNSVNGVCVKLPDGSGGGGSGGDSGGSGGQGSNGGGGGSAAVCNRGICPEGLCETNGICLPKPSGSGESFVAQSTLVGLLLKIIRFLLTFAGIIAVVVLVVGGFWYITSAGNEEQAEKGQKAITNAIIGLVVVILAYTIVTIISSTLVADKFV